ncbi:hypothetical protein R6Q57_018722 [Mikania cordata]
MISGDRTFAVQKKFVLKFPPESILIVVDIYIYMHVSKENIDLTLMRIEIIKRRRNAMQKHLRSDIAELLKIAHNSDAFQRVERLYLDQNRSLCYDFVARYCMLILDKLPIINDSRECPEECKEAVSSLTYAAAWFGDLPELPKLRALFFERYGNSIEPLVNKEFVNLLKPDRPTKDMKVGLMQEIAQGHGLVWDPESLDNELNIPCSSKRDWSEHAYNHQDKESHTSTRENGWMIKIQETTNDVHKKHKSNDDDDDDDIVKQTENMRQRILDFWSRTPSLLSTNTSSEETSTSSDDSTKSRPFFNPNTTTKKPDDVSKNANVEDWDDGKTIATTRRVRNRWRRKGGDALPLGKLHPAERLLNPIVEKEPKASKGRASVASFETDPNENQPSVHVHPKLPDYDVIKAWFETMRAKY